MRNTPIISTFLLCACLSMSFTSSKKAVKLLAPSATVTVYLSGSSSAGYRIVLHNNNTGYEKTVPMQNSTVSVPIGNYTVGILPSGGGAPSGGSYTFSGSSCAVGYNASGGYASWYNVDLTCSTASFSMY